MLSGGSFFWWEETTRVSRRKALTFGLSVIGFAAWSQEGSRQLPESAWSALMRLPAIDAKEMDTDSPQLVIFFDPNCPVCGQLWERLYAPGSAYRGTASRWIPVAYMGQDSLKKAATLLADRSKNLLSLNFAKPGVGRQQRSDINGPSSEPRDADEDKVRSNTTYWSKLGAATPAIVYRTKGEAVFLQLGLMPEPAFSNMMGSLRRPRLSEFK